MHNPSAIFDLLHAGADDDVAIAAPGRTPLTYARLRAAAACVVDRLNRLGIGRNDRVAMVLPNGPEMAATFVTIAAAATTAPLNPGYRAAELDFSLRDLAPKALIVDADHDGPARDAAMRLSLPILELCVPDGAPAGQFTFSEVTPLPSPHGATSGGYAEPDDVALLLHTSGTTSRPKLVPLSHRNICASARHICQSLALTPADRCLNIMPLFHIHGLIGAVLSSLCAGAAVVCTPGFNVFNFFSWLRELRPTWYTAVPSMHQAILTRAARHAAIIETKPLRFIRSCSSSLRPQLKAEIEAVFHAPVIESYGMTEAAHQITSNPLPPAPRKPGTVGRATGPEVAIMDAAGRLLPADHIGEVVVRGDTVMQGYDHNPTANAEAFVNGWLRTGDEGWLDTDGYLSITGRLKEIINRGGEKISPREVEEVLLEHPAVAEAVTFAVPHPALGEQAAAAVVLRHGQSATARALRAFAATRLAEFKVPRKIVIVDALPEGATGKPQRIGLAQKLGLSADDAS